MDGNVRISVSITVPEKSRTFLDSALLRVGYLHPHWLVTSTSEGVVVEVESGPSEAEVRREILYSVYREKILAETLDLRRGLIAFVESA